jgi:capsular polysaccharide biosynthesis protein
MGVHGAGLANCIFASPGAVVVEFQNLHNFGFDGFVKVGKKTPQNAVFVIEDCI